LDGTWKPTKNVRLDSKLKLVPGVRPLELFEGFFSVLYDFFEESLVVLPSGF
jgi:hypothetical protein